jgi:hypothetical protein
MAKPAADQLGETWGRFFAHWIAATFGFFLKSLLPVVNSWSNPSIPVDFPRWWAAIFFAALVSLVASVINANMPVTPRELLKSVGLGFALNAATVMMRIGPT